MVATQMRNDASLGGSSKCGMRNSECGMKSAYEGTNVRGYADEKPNQETLERVPSGLLEPYIRTLVRSYALGFVHSFRIPRSATLSCQMA
jgi:hypothetical protein